LSAGPNRKKRNNFIQIVAEVLVDSTLVTFLKKMYLHFCSKNERKIYEILCEEKR